MARFKEHDRKQTILVPVHYADQLIPGTIEFAIDEIVEHHIDTAIFASRYRNDITGAKAYAPSVLLKIILLAYARGCYSSRKIERLCESNIIFMAISANARPDHSTIAAFVSSMGEKIKTVFTEILMRCAQLDLVGGELFALDGCKISSNAAKEWSGTFKELESKKEKLSKVLDTMMKAHVDGDVVETETMCERCEKYRRKIEKIDAFLKSATPRKGKRKGENQSNITDNESAKMKSSHGVVQGYNGIAVVDEQHQVIVHAEAFGQVAEGDLPGMISDTTHAMEMIRNGWKIRGKKVIADTGYFSERNCEYLAKHEIDAYIPDVQFRSRDPRFPDYHRRKPGRRQLFGHDDFTFNGKENHYTCPMGHTLKFDGKRTMHGYLGRRYTIKDQSCLTCHRKTECLKKGARIRSLFITDVPRPKTFSVAMIERIDTPQGRDMYSKRMGIVEPVFANIRYCKGLDRFTLRGKKKVNIQWLLYCCVHNIEKTLKAAI